MDDRTAPVQIELRSGYANSEPLSIPWWLHELIYVSYAKLYGKTQTAERMAERGGFGCYEALTLIRDLGPDGIRAALADTADKCTNPAGKDNCACRGEGCEYWRARVVRLREYLTAAHKEG